MTVAKTVLSVSESRHLLIAYYIIFSALGVSRDTIMLGRVTETKER